MAGFKAFAENKDLMGLKEKLELEEDEKASKAKGQEQDVKSQEQGAKCKNANTATSVPQKEKILLTFLSTYNVNANEAEYHADSDVVLKGAQTNDAPVQYLMSSPEQKITKIFCIVSQSVHKEVHTIEGDKKTRFGYFKDQIEQYATAFGYQDEIPEIVEIKYDFYDNGNMVKGDKTSYVLEQLSSEFAKCADADVYIDYTGGLRDMNFFMTILVRLLEFQGKRCAKIVYADLAQKRIVGLGNTYNLLQLINGMEMFMATGNPMLLVELVDRIPDGVKKEKIKALCKALVDFSNNISICAVSDIQSKWVAIKDALNEVSKFGESDVYNLLFKSFVTTMKDKMGLDNEGDDEIFKIVEWCKNNRLFQQALTILHDHILHLYYARNKFFSQKWNAWDAQNKGVRVNMSLSKPNDLINCMKNRINDSDVIPKDISKEKVEEFLKVLKNDLLCSDDRIIDVAALSSNPNYKEFDSLINLFGRLSEMYDDIHIKGEPENFGKLLNTLFTSGTNTNSFYILYRCALDENTKNYALLKDIAISLEGIVTMRNKINHANASNLKIDKIVGGLNRAIALSRMFLK